MPQFHTIQRVANETRRDLDKGLSWRFLALREGHILVVYSLAFWFDSRRFTIRVGQTPPEDWERKMVALYGDRPLFGKGKRVTSILRAMLGKDEIAECMRRSIEHQNRKGPAS